jgi:hypothetical protein
VDQKYISKGWLYMGRLSIATQGPANNPLKPDLESGAVIKDFKPTR